jgi:hypothetical protein
VLLLRFLLWFVRIVFPLWFVRIVFPLWSVLNLWFRSPWALALDELPREITFNELREEQDRDPEIKELLATGGPSRVIYVNPYGIIVRKAPIDGCEQILVPRLLRPIFLHLEHHPKCSGHPGVTEMYSTMRISSFWRSMYKDVEDTVRHCTSCAKNRVQERKRIVY